MDSAASANRIGRPGGKTVLTVALLALLLGAAGALWLLLQWAGWDFRNNLWGPAHLLLHGQSPYRVDLLYERTDAVWFPQTIGVFFPLGWLNLNVAAALWFIGNLFLVLAILWRYSREEGASPPVLGAALVATLLFPPVIFHLILGQISLLTVVLLLLAAQLVAQQRFAWAGLALVLALGKPQLAVLAVPGLWIAAVRGGKWRGALLLPGATVLGSGLATLPLWTGYPGWLPDFLHGPRYEFFWWQPSLYTWARLAGTVAAWIGPVLLSLALLVLNLWLWWKYPPEEVMPWSLALTTVASPYFWTWDFVLLLPLILRSLFRQRSWLARTIWGTGLAASIALMSWIRLAVLSLEDQRHHLYVWVPWFIFLLALASHAAESRRSGTGWQPLLQSWPGPEEDAA